MTAAAPGVPVAAPEPRPPKVRTRPGTSLVEPSILRRAARAAFVKLDPRTMIRNPVMFVVEIGSVVTTVEFAGRPSVFVGRFTPIVLALAIAGSLAGARVHARTRATLDTAGPTFAAFLLGVIVIVGGLIYFPMLILGPIGERIAG
jgi:hypothetical protein